MSRGKTATPTSSPAPSGRGATRKAGRSKIDWDKVKVFEKPEFRVPFTFQKYRNGKKSGIEPELWMQVAVESGLVEMGSPHEDGGVGEWYEPTEGFAKPYMSRAELEALLVKGIADLVDPPSTKEDK